ncbi:MAG: hypothetical protein PHS93_03175 [Candidatus Omnitrophica bacterium]|nr:hypothetical protein [Candidatus Omnitrophota bacterium]MDD5352153.1 hypothetical protein [Candidatus Omnitrophota bacterium]MDD5549751.1 hypothetical protein [Candidatus Omnitrophota bacterium]
MDKEKLINFLKRNWWVFFVVIFAAIEVYWIWQVEYLGFQDHPSHLFRLHVVANYNNPLYDYHKYFLLNWGLTPNQGSDIIVFLLSKIFSVQVAGKLFFCLYIILLPLSMWYFLKGVRPENCAYTLLASALSFSYFVKMGNENFLSSIPVFLFFLGYWYRHRDNFTVYTQLTNSLLLLFLYYCHMLSFVCALVTIIAVSLVERKKLRTILRTILVSLPGLFLFFAWVIRIMLQGATKESGLLYITPYSSWLHKARSLTYGIFPFSFATLSVSNILISLFLILVFYMIIVGIVYRWRQGKRIWLWAIITLTFFAIVLPRDFIILMPGQRIIYLVLLIAPVIFLNKGILRFCFLSFLIVFTAMARIDETEYLITGDKIISYIVAPFKEVPQVAINHQEKVLPLVLYPYKVHPFGHRVFEYYNLFNGGVNPYHAMSHLFTVRYRINLPASHIYESKINSEIFKAYDIIIVIGRDTYKGKGKGLLDYLSSIGFREISGNAITAVLKKL